VDIRALTPAHAGDVARIHRAAFDARLPWLAGLHTPAEDLAFFRDRVFADCRVEGAFVGSALLGFIAVRPGWIDHLYVSPHAQGGGAGTALVGAAQATFSALSLWTFQKNFGARRFYERRGFVAAEETDGTRNAEREPDVRYVWRRG
jgi:GNAT superfamily N-acetyltransferase